MTYQPGVYVPLRALFLVVHIHGHCLIFTYVVSKCVIIFIYYTCKKELVHVFLRFYGAVYAV